MLKVENLSFEPILQNISLYFLPGSINGILGPNGSGKTTFLKTLKKIWEPTSGEVFWHAAPLHRLSRKKISEVMTLVPQNPHVSFDFTVKEFIIMGRYPCDTVDPESYNKTLHLLGLENLQSRLITEISGGERQRVYIARSLITEAPVILLDEPTANLDISHQQSILFTLQELAHKGKTVILTTHDLSIAETLCDQVALFSQGRCVSTGPFQESVTPEILYRVFGIRPDIY